MYKIPLFFTLIIALSIISCENTTEEIEEFGYDYTPLAIGNQWVYESDSIIFTQEGMIVDTFSSMIREEIIDTFRNGENQLTYSIARSVKKDTLPWSQPRSWTANLSSTNYIRTEENLKFIKLVFPTDVGSDWDGNAFFDESINISVAGEQLRPYRFWDYNIAENQLSYENGEISSTDVLRVSHVDLEDILEKRFSEELYARGIGLVYKEMIILDSQCITCTGDFEDFAEKGYILRQSLVSFNN